VTYGLYTDNVSAPLQAGAGLRQAYGFGLYSYCAYVNKKNGSCTRSTITYQFQPYTVITKDLPSNYSDRLNTILNNSAFADSSSLARSSRAACYLLLLGPILLLISLVGYVRPCPLIFGFDSLAFVPPSGPLLLVCGHTSGFFVSGSAAILATISVFTGSVIWTALIKKAKDDNPWKVHPAQLGIVISAGKGLTLAWVASGFLLAITTPLMFGSASFFRLIPMTPEP